MPGAVAAANPTVVMPRAICLLFEVDREWKIYENVYPSGEIISGEYVSEPRRSWRIQRGLTASEYADLLDFFEDHPADEFWFYDPWETSPKFSHDPTGSASAGRHAVRFASGLELVCGLARSAGSFSLIQVS